MQPDESEPIGGERSTSSEPTAMTGDRADTVDTPKNETRLRIDVAAAGVARAAVTQALARRVTDAAIGSAQLIVSELVSNSVRHCGETAAEDTIVVRVNVTPTAIRLEVDDPGNAGTVSLRAPDVERGGGFGLHLVQALSERWGSEPVPGGGTRVWAEFLRGPPGLTAVTS